MKLVRALCCLFLLATLPLLAAEEPVRFKIRAKDPRTDARFDPATGVASAPGGVIVTYGEITLSANSVTANRNTGEVVADGDVTIVGKDLVWKGEHVIYNFKTGESQAQNFKTSSSTYFIKGAGLGGDQSNQVYTTVGNIITTDDFEDPAYKVRAKELTLVPNDYFEAKHAVLFIGDVPVFYWPYYRRNLKSPNHWEFQPGYRSSYGPYFLTSYHWYHGEALSGSVHFDLRQKRGVAYGPDFRYDAGKWGEGEISYYTAHDNDPPTRYTGSLVAEDRQRLRFSHAIYPDTNRFAKAVVNYQTDEFVLRDFFESDYRNNVQPQTFVELNRFWDNWMLDVLVHPRINEFWEQVERLPDVKLSGFRQQIGNTPFYYESESSLGYYQRSFASTNSIQPNFSAFRGDSYHEILLPKNFFGWLNFTPRMGGRLTYYGEADGPGAMTDEEYRGVFNTGAEVSFKASRVLTDAENKLFDVRGLRHIIEPSVNYVYVPRPNVRPRDLPQFDYELPSFRLLPIEFPDYNAIDAIDSQNVLRFTLRNKLQTKRDPAVENLVNWALYNDWRLTPRRNQSTFSDLYSDLDFRPRTWLVLNSETRFDILDRTLHEADHRITMVPNNVWSFTIGHRFLDDPAFGPSSAGHNLIYDSFYYRINENWSWRMVHYFEARDGTMQEQSYTVYRDLRSWTAALTVRLQDSRGGEPTDFSVGVSFSLKAFPRYGVGGDRINQSYLLGQ